MTIKLKRPNATDPLGLTFSVPGALPLSSVQVDRVGWNELGRFVVASFKLVHPVYVATCAPYHGHWYSLFVFRSVGSYVVVTNIDTRPTNNVVHSLQKGDVVLAVDGVEVRRAR